MRLLTILLAFSTICGAPSLSHADKPVDIAQQRAELRRKVQGNSIPGWKKGGAEQAHYFRTLEFRGAVAKSLTDRKLVEDTTAAEPIANLLLKTTDPVASLVAYEHLIDWVQAKKNPELDGEFQLEIVAAHSGESTLPDRIRTSFRACL